MTKVRVTTALGTTGTIGLINPKVAMETNYGPILSLDSGNYQVVVGVGTGDVPQRFYPHQLQITQTQATGDHAWPTGDGGIKFGRSGIWPNGVPEGVGTGVSIGHGDGVYTFGR